ncbi:MAG: tetratricopeptide repeat protein [Bryobacteraceae bacterium]
MKKTKRQREIKVAPAVAGQRRGFRWWPWATAAAALFIVFEVYGPAIYGAFVFDDYHLPFFTPNVSPNFSAWVHPFGIRPLLMLSFWIDYTIGHGSDPFVFHVTNVLLHFATSALAARIAAKLLEWAGVAGKMRAALAVFAGALFLLHPLQTESVAYVASRSEALSVMFYYAAFAVFLYRQSESITLPRSIAVLALFAAALETKEHTLTLPALFLLTDYFWGRGGLRKNWILYSLLAAAGAVGAAFIWRVLRFADTAGFHLQGLNPLDYFFTQCRVIWIYVRMFFLPFGQNIDPDVAVSTGPLNHGAIFGLIALIALIAAAWIYRKRFPLASFGVFVFLLLLAPTSSFAPIKDVMAEHRLYLPFLGLALGCLEFARRLKFSQAVWAGAAALAICCILTYQRNQVWANPLALWQDSVSKSPNKYRPRFQLAYAEFIGGRCPESAKSYEAASRLAPEDDRILVDWALALDCAGNPREAIDKLKRSERYSNTAHVHAEIGRVYLTENDVSDAMVELAESAKIDPGYSMTYAYRGKAYEMSGNRAAAAQEYRRALTLDPNIEMARDALIQVSR